MLGLAPQYLFPRHRFDLMPSPYSLRYVAARLCGWASLSKWFSYSSCQSAVVSVNLAAHESAQRPPPICCYLAHCAAAHAVAFNTFERGVVDTCGTTQHRARHRLQPPRCQPHQHHCNRNYRRWRRCFFARSRYFSGRSKRSSRY